MGEHVTVQVRPIPTDELVIRSHHGISPLASLRELIRYRSVVAALLQRSITVRYKQAVLGAAWALIQPLAYLGIFSIIFGRIARVPGPPGVPYAAFLLTTLIPWQFTATAIPLGLNSLVAEAPLLRKVYLPLEALVIGVLGPAFVDLALGMLMLLAIAPLLGAHLGVGVLAVPLLLAVLLLPVLGFSFAAASLNAYYRDIRLAVPLLVQLWLYTSPVVYPITAVSPRFRNWYALVNPLVGPLDGFRHAIGYGEAPDFALLGLSACTGLLILVAGHGILKRLEPDLVDVV